MRLSHFGGEWDSDTLIWPVTEVVKSLASVSHLAIQKDNTDWVTLKMIFIWGLHFTISSLSATVNDCLLCSIVAWKTTITAKMCHFSPGQYKSPSSSWSVKLGTALGLSFWHSFLFSWVYPHVVTSICWIEGTTSEMPDGICTWHKQDCYSIITPSEHSYSAATDYQHYQ
jgi:hypothetical protein